MKKFSLLLFLIIHYTVIRSQNVIILDHGGSTRVETRLDSTISHAQSGDIIYLPGGLIGGSSGVIPIYKKVSIIGAGYHPDSAFATSPTIVSAKIAFNSGADGSQLTGIYLQGSIIINCNNFYLTRCDVSDIVLGSGALSNILVEENICRTNLSSTITGSTPALSNVYFNKNIIYGNGDQIAIGGVTFSNNIIFGYLQLNGSAYPAGCLFKNNIFLLASSLSGQWGSNNQYQNNLFVNSNSVSINNTESGNIFNQPLANIFTNYTSGAPWNQSQNFHLKAGCSGIGLGLDGTDVGIYGTAAPFKEGGSPFNPHIQSAIIPNSTNTNGSLNINIKVTAQDH